MIRIAISGLMALSAAACTTVPSEGKATNAVAGIPEGTLILDQEEAERLLTVRRIGLQWITPQLFSWESLGHVVFGRDGEVIYLRGVQSTYDGSASVEVIGRVAEIGTDYFILDGTITIENTPDAGRSCELTRPDWRFAVTQNRPYYRLREFEWCDGLTDYIDLYHPRSPSS